MKNDEKNTAKKTAEPEKICKAADAETLTDEALEKVAGGVKEQKVREEEKKNGVRKR